MKGQADPADTGDGAGDDGEARGGGGGGGGGIHGAICC